MDLQFIKTFEAFHKEEFDKLISLNKIYIRSNPSNRNIESEDITYKDILIKIRNFDINKLIFKETPYGIFIYPDNEFKRLLDELNTHIKEKIPDDFFFYITIDKNNLNQIDFTEGIPKELWGISFGYKLYKLIIKKIKYFTTNKSSNKKAYNIWYNLMLDKELYCYTSALESGVIYKNISNRELLLILEKIRKADLIFDPELIEKIVELYGSMDTYKQED